MKSRPGRLHSALLLPQVAKGIAEAINEVVPRGYSVIASWVTEDPMVILVNEGVGIRGVTLSEAQLSTLGEGDDDLPTLLEVTLSEALNQFQDEIVYQLNTAWPSPSGSHHLPLPGTSVEGGLLRGWYGDKEEPVVALRPIALPKRG